MVAPLGVDRRTPGFGAVSPDIHHQSQRIRDGADRSERENSSPTPRLLTNAGALISAESPFGMGNTESPFTTRGLDYDGNRSVGLARSFSHPAVQRFSVQAGDDKRSSSEGLRLADHLPDSHDSSSNSTESLRVACGLASILDGTSHADSSYIGLVASHSGTAVRPFKPYKEAEIIAEPNRSRWLAYQHILFQAEYRDQSNEELRLADYLVGRYNRNRDGIGLDKVGMGVGSLGGPFFGVSTTTNAGFGSPRDAGHLGPSMSSCDDDADSDNCCPGTSVDSFKATIEDDPSRHGEKFAYQHISFQDGYRHWSTEELRLADYYKRTQRQGTVVGPNVSCSSGLGLEGRVVSDVG